MSAPTSTAKRRTEVGPPAWLVDGARNRIPSANQSIVVQRNTLTTAAVDELLMPDLELDIETGHILTVAAGLGAEAETNIGSIGK